MVDIHFAPEQLTPGHSAPGFLTKMGKFGAKTANLGAKMDKFGCEMSVSELSRCEMYVCQTNKLRCLQRKGRQRSLKNTFFKATGVLWPLLALTTYQLPLKELETLWTISRYDLQLVGPAAVTFFTGNAQWESLVFLLKSIIGPMWLLLLHIWKSGQPHGD